MDIIGSAFMGASTLYFYLAHDILMFKIGIGVILFVAVLDSIVNYVTRRK